ncbi:MAG TPA: hypothetical protein VM328_01630 [Fimbriimonadaceae bacterium]|nr:hypothetical protein [Fimbriimonadaceae bacterium]
MIQFAFLTGQGRAPGDPIAEIRRIYLNDSELEPLPQHLRNDPLYRVETVLNPVRLLGLEQFTYQVINVNARVPASMDSRFFDSLTLEVNRVLVEDDSGMPIEPFPQTPPVVLEEFPAHIRAFQGRQTIVPIFLDSAILNQDGISVTFDRDLFELSNLSFNEGAIVGFLNDYVMFDISNVPDKPTMTGGSPATRVYFSGDGIALSAQAGSSRPFEVLGLFTSVEGVWAPPTTLTPDFGTYSLLGADPRDLSGVAKITSLMGIFRPYTQVLANLSTFDMITFPNSREGADQDMVAIIRNGAGQIVDMYFGVVDFDEGTFSAFPISQVDDGSIAGEVSGTISNIVRVSSHPDREFSSIRSASFTVTGGTPPNGFPTSGFLVVFRR